MAKQSAKSVPIQNNLVNSAFQIVEVDHYIEVVDWRSTTFRSEHKFLLVAQIPSRFFVREYFWTGSGYEKEPIPELVTDIDSWGFPHQRVHGPVLIEGDARIVVVDLGRTIGVGERVVVHFRQRLKDLNGTFQPYFVVRPSKGVRRRIGLKVILPGWTGLRMMYQRFTHDTEKVVESHSLPPVQRENSRLTFEKELINPDKHRMGHRLQWSHDEPMKP